MQVFQIRQGRTGAILWTGAASSATQALDAMAHAAGYRDGAALPETVRGSGLAVETLAFKGSTAPEAVRGSTVTGGRSGRVAMPEAKRAASGRRG